MQSPPKKPIFTPVAEYDSDKPVPLVGLPELSKPEADAVAAAETSVASTIKSEEADEPLLRENGNRFVLFPIKYHEVRRPF